MDWNKFVKAIGDYHGIECGQVDTMEEADSQLAEMYFKELPANADMVEELEAYCKMVRKALTGGIHESHVSQIEKILSKYRPVKASDKGVE